MPNKTLNPTSNLIRIWWDKCHELQAIKLVFYCMLLYWQALDSTATKPLPKFKAMVIRIPQIVSFEALVRSRIHSGYELSQRETMLQYYIVSHWLSPHPEWFWGLLIGHLIRQWNGAEDLLLRYWSWDKMVVDILQTTFSNTFLVWKFFEFQIKFHWSMVLGI